MKKKLMTTKDLFNRVCSILKEKGRMPDIPNYRLATHRPVPIKTYEFDLKSNLAYEGSGGDPVRVKAGVLVNSLGTLVCGRTLSVGKEGVPWLADGDLEWL